MGDFEYLDVHSISAEYYFWKMDKFVRANDHYRCTFFSYWQAGIQNFNPQISCQVFSGHEMRRQALNFNAVSLRVHLDIRWSAQVNHIK